MSIAGNGLRTAGHRLAPFAFLPSTTPTQCSPEVTSIRHPVGKGPDLAKVRVVGSNPIARSKSPPVFQEATTKGPDLVSGPSYFWAAPGQLMLFAILKLPYGAFQTRRADAVGPRRQPFSRDATNQQAPNAFFGDV